MASSGLPWLDYVSEWIPSLQQYGGHPVGFDSVSPLTMESGKPYFVSVREDTNITLYGWAPEKQEVDVEITYEEDPVTGDLDPKSSFNFITLPIDTELETGYDLCVDLIDRGVSDGNTQIYVWDEITQEYVVAVDYTCSQIIADYGTPFGENFNLIPGKTYRFEAQSEGTWLQK